MLFTLFLNGVAGTSAGELLKQAKTKADSEKKNLFVVFGASWCSWCKKLDAYVHNPSIQPVLDKYVVYVHLDVMENEARKDLENPGGEQEMDRLGGKGAGLPFFAFTNPKGETLITSIRPKDAKWEGGNVGFPGTGDELEWFIAMVKKAAPRITEAEITTLKMGIMGKK